MKNYVNFNNFRKDAEEALEKLQKKYGVEISAGNIRYNETSFTMQLKVTRADVDIQKQDFMNNLLYMRAYGFSEDDYLAEFRDKTRTCTIIGFKPGNKYNVVVEADNGRKYSYTADAVKAFMKKAV